MPQTPLTRQQGGLLVKIILIGMVSQLFVIGYIFWAGHEGRQDTVTSQRAGCERSKKDRKDNADFQRAHTTYIQAVTGASSVKGDVKKVARTALKTFRRTAGNLEQRSKLSCTKAYPNAKWVP